jgi:WD40 repeat protein
MKIELRLTVLTVFIILVLGFVGCQVDGTTKREIIKYEINGTVQGILSSPDGKTVVYYAKDDDLQKDFIGVNGGEVKKYDVLGHIFISPDGSVVAHPAFIGSKCVMVINGDARSECDGLVPIAVFSSNSKRFAYVGKSENKQFVVVDDVEGKKYDKIGLIDFSPDSENVAYEAAKDKKAFIVINHMERGGYDWVRFSEFSPDGKSYVYTARKDKKEFVVLDDIEQKQYDVVSPAVFSPDGKSIAYSAKQGDKWLVVQNETEEKKYDAVTPPDFSSDSKILVYGAKENGKWFMVVNGIEKRQYDFVTTPWFSPTGQMFSYAAEQHGKTFIVLGDIEMKKHENVGYPFFSPDGHRLAYIANNGGKPLSCRTIINYSETEGGKWLMVIDGKEGKHYIDRKSADIPIYAPVFSSDSKNVIYTVRLKENGEFMVCNGEEGKWYDNITNPVFIDNFTFSYFALDGKTLYRITQKIESVSPVGR